jgi:hypothetical protein
MKQTVKRIFQPLQVERLDIRGKHKHFRGIAEHVLFNPGNLRLDSGLCAFPFAAAFFRKQKVVELLPIVAQQRNRQREFPSVRQLRLQFGLGLSEFAVTFLSFLHFFGINRAERLQVVFDLEKLDLFLAQIPLKDFVLATPRFENAVNGNDFPI